MIMRREKGAERERRDCLVWRLRREDSEAKGMRETVCACVFK